MPSAKTVHAAEYRRSHARLLEQTDPSGTGKRRISQSPSPSPAGSAAVRSIFRIRRLMRIISRTIR